MPGPAETTKNRGRTMADARVDRSPSWTKERDAVWKPFKDKEAELKGAPGKALSDWPEEAGGVEFVRYEHGVIYKRPDGKCVRVHGDINKLYQNLKGPESWLGLPVHDEGDLQDNEGGRVSLFDNGQIYWWKDVGAIELNDVVVRYTGLFCHETSSGPGSDEPYAIMSVAVPRLPDEAEIPVSTIRSQVYDEVDKGDWRADSVEVYRGKARGLILTIVLMENDEGDPDKYTSEIQGATKAGAGALAAVVGGAAPVLIPVLAAASPLIATAANAVGKAISGIFDTGDDDMGTKTVPLTAKELVLLAARTPKTPGGITWKKEIGRFDGDGANYSVYLDFDPA